MKVQRVLVACAFMSLLSGMTDVKKEMDPMHKLRILCFHGYHGSGTILRDQIGGLASTFGPSVELVFVDAPSLSNGDFGWWHAVASPNATDRGNPGVGPSTVYYKGWEKTRAWLVDVFAQKGPFDGVFGFSQGAALAGLAVGMRAPNGKPTEQKPLVFAFAIMVGGFSSQDAALAKMYGESASYDLPSLHIIGRSDGIVPSSRSYDLASHFKKPVILEHDGGHVIASTPEVRRGVTAFLEARRQGVSSAVAQTGPRAPIMVPLWPGRTSPAMRVYFPVQTGKPAAALVVLRGGAYATSSGSGGGSAQWAAQNGMVGIEVAYRTREVQAAYPAGYADAARAVRLARAHAGEWNLDPHRVGVLGYSAGGHLASLLSTQPNLYKDPADDLASQISARPDLVVLGYPLISFVDGYAPGAFVGSVSNFFGKAASDEERRAFSNELHVTAQHPPTFVWTTADDALVPASHSELFAAACQRAGVPVVLKVYPRGPHGMGLALEQSGDVRQWTSLLLTWLRQQWG